MSWRSTWGRSTPTEHADGTGPVRGPRHDALTAWVGRWINEGHVIDGDGSAGPAIATCDVYECGEYTSRFFDSQGNVTLSSLVARGDTWTCQGATTRSTVEFGDGHRVQRVLHERTDDKTTYRPSMKVTLVKVV